MSAYITNELFSDFTNCQYRAYLRLSGVRGENSELEDNERRLSVEYRIQAHQHLLRRHLGRSASGASVPLASLPDKACTLVTDVTIRHGDLYVHVDALVADTRAGNATESTFVPVMFTYEEKLSRNRKLLLALCASALAAQQGARPPFGRILHGAAFKSSKVQLDRLWGEVDKIVAEMRALRDATEPPTLCLNPHCGTCEFRQRCHAAAVEKDDLSLLQGIKAKEIAKLNSRGIFTVTQLSYTFRPRRRSKRSSPANIKHHHSLKALAIRERNIYVTGRPELTLTGTPVYLDVEGVPDQDFYYLIGLRTLRGGKCVQHSFWADDRTAEERIWSQCLDVLRTLERPQLLHYGSYETTFLRCMGKRYAHRERDAADLRRLMDGAVNVLSVIYGQIYFPTYSNGLKDVASFLGHTWSGKDVSGPRSLLWRSRWEATHEPEIWRDLITYNAEDCAALEVVVKALQAVIQREALEAATRPHPDAVHTDDLEPERSYGFGPVDFALPDFEHINRCAYWDYQRDRVYIRSSPRLRQVARRKAKRAKRRRSVPVNATVGPSPPGRCPKCRSPRVLKRGRSSRLLRDLKFSAGGVKRWITKYVTTYYECGDCAQLFTSDKHECPEGRYGRQLLAYVIYCIIGLNMPQARLAGAMKTFFGFSPAMPGLKKRAADLYGDAHAAIKKKLLEASVVHADETRLSTKRKAGYVWVFTSMEEVVYVWAETREGDVVREFLDGFNGVLVSDFYAAYDSIDCPQQKCLVHLIRDLNSDVTKEPFNEELRELVQDFATVVKAMIETIDRFGLKRYFLKKHKKEVGRFYERLSANVCETETARKVQDRLEKNRDKLFTFLDHDGVSWNNNNAEHAIKAFSRLRDVIQCYTNEAGVRDYLVLLSVYQTCVYKGLDFLDFLRSGAMTIDEYIQRRAT